MKKLLALTLMPTFYLTCFSYIKSQALASTPTWQYHAPKGAICRSGSPAGYFLRTQKNSKKLVIGLGGGGACFNGITCLGNANTVSNQRPSDVGILDLRKENPTHTWNHAFVPYCTGDAFTGNAKNVHVPGGPRGQHFVGFANLTIFFNEIKKKLPNLEKILLVGVSAGGFGIAFNYDQANQIFKGSKVLALDDSGVPFDDEFMAPCLQRKWRNLWGWKNSLPKDCKECYQENGGGIIRYFDYLKEKYPDLVVGFISSYSDRVIRWFYGFGRRQCRSLFPGMSKAFFRSGLFDAIENQMDTMMTSFLFKGFSHTHLYEEDFYKVRVDGKSIHSWVADFIDGNAHDVRGY